MVGVKDLLCTIRLNCFVFFSVCSSQAMTARLEVFDSKINDYKNENQTLTNELTSFKKKYFSQKKLYR